MSVSNYSQKTNNTSNTRNRKKENLKDKPISYLGVEKPDNRLGGVNGFLGMEKIFATHQIADESKHING